MALDTHNSLGYIIIIYYNLFLYVCHAIILLKTIVLFHVIVTSSVCMYTKSLLALRLGGGGVCN